MRRKHFGCKHKEWSEEEINYLKENYKKHSVNSLAQYLQRSSEQISSKIARLKIKKNKPAKQWSEEDLKFIKYNYARLGGIGCSKFLNFSQREIHQKANHLKLRKRLILIAKEGNKICRKCKEEKALEEFQCRTDSKDGKRSHCRLCTRNTLKSYNIENKQKINVYKINYKIQNRKKIREWHKNYRKERRKTNVNYKLRTNISRRVLLAIKERGAAKHMPTMNLVGCDIDFLRKYLESKFQPGMTWENHGTYGWHIDHIVPCDAFDLVDPEQQKRRFHYTNLQPLWATKVIARQHGSNSIGNLEKGSKIQY